MENDRLIMPSFLMSEQQTPNICKYTFKRIGVLKLKKLIEQIENMEKSKDFQDILNKNDLIFDRKFRANHQKQLNLPLFELEIQDKYKKWKQIIYHHLQDHQKLEDLIELQKSLKPKYNDRVPTCPKRSWEQIGQKDLELVLIFFQTFMKTISNKSQITQQKSYKKFIQNLVPDQRRKIKIFKQMKLNKKAGGRHNESNFSKMLTYFTSWTHKYFSITSEGFYYTDSDDNFEIKEMIPFNQTFTILYGQIKTGYTYGIIINSSHRILQVDAQDIFSLILFVYFLKLAQKQNENQDSNAYESFAKVRQKCEAKYFIDGKDYFENMYEQILKAKKQIFITGWMLSPYFCLIRQFQQKNQGENNIEFANKIQASRIDRLFQKVAKSGIKINIIIYNAPTMALNIDSQFTRTYLQSLSNNIKVLCHPNYYFIPFLWSHHQKMVIIDQKIAFLGGLDIGYGRMDDKNHRITDPDQITWKGVDYCNYRATDILNPKNFQQSSVNRKEVCRMPWHDIGVKIKGLSVLDLTRHFVQYWNYVNFQLHMSQRQLLLFTGLHEQDIGLQPSKIQKLKQSPQSSRKQKIKHQTSYNPYRSGRRFIEESQQFNLQQLIQQGHVHQREHQRGHEINDQNFSNIHIPNDGLNYHQSLDLPKMKKLRSSQFIVESHDEKDDEKGHQEQIQFYSNYIKTNKQDMKDKIKELKQFFKKMNPKQILSGDKKKNDNDQIQDLIATEFSQKRNSDLDGFQRKQNEKMQEHQILRSASMWGLGLQQLNQQKSIYNAYVKLIYNSREFIYIQNQFFISVQNTVSKAIKERIKRAYQRKQNFKVCVVIPFLPGFDGQPQSQSSAVFRIQIHHIYSTICRGNQSILEKLKYIKNLSDYIQFYCLRTHSKLNNKPVTEIIYVHSKLMIVDDQYALIGSANINDRSLLGSRDSQIAVLIRDEDTIQIPIQKGQKRIVRRFAHSLRKQLYMEHFATTQKEAQNYMDQEIWQRIYDNAQKNQKFYRRIFGCYPDDSIESFSDLQLMKSYAQLQKYDQIKDLIIGHACPFQRKFLQKQDLRISAGQKQYLVPSISFT